MKGRGCFFKSCLAGIGGIAGLGILVIISPVVLEFILWSMGAYLIVADPIQQVDAVVILSGGTDDSRLDEAARLYEDKVADKIIITETGETLPDSTVSRTFFTRQQLGRLGVPEEAIITTEKHVSSTWSEARVVMKLMLGLGMKSCIVVTDPFHTRRARLVFRDEFTPRGIEVFIQPVRGHWYKSSTWWTSKRGWEVTIDEYSKLFGYVFLDMKQN
jgi:uncharacterized SAM-binding protein YcdF (DUF218 family)